MSRELLFWLLLTLWLVLGAIPYARGGERNWPGMGSALIVWGAVALLGWQVFGPIVK